MSNSITQDSLDVVFWNNGDVTLVAYKRNGYGYQHTYDDAAQAATDAQLIDAGDDFQNWEGNEFDDPCGLRADYESYGLQSDYGSYVMPYSHRHTSELPDSWGNIRKFIATLR